MNNTREKVSKKADNSKQLLQIGYEDLDNYIGSLPQGGLITIERDTSLSNDIIFLFLNDILYNFSRRHYCLLLDSSIKDELVLTYNFNIQNYGKLFALDSLGSAENSIEDAIKQKESFYNFVAKIVSRLEGKIVTIMESNSLDNFMSTCSDIEDYCRFIKKFELSFLILNSNNNPENITQLRIFI